MQTIDLGSNSIQKRLVLSFMLTTGLALLLASTAFFFSEFYKFRGGMVRNLTVLAEVIGTNSGAPLLFHDGDTAEEVLKALEAQVHVVAAVVYDGSGMPFARFEREGAEGFEVPPVGDVGHQTHDGWIDLFQPIVLDGESLGTVFIRSDTTELDEFITVFLLIVVVVTLGALLVCYLGASILRKQIATPLLALVEGSGRMAEGDLSVQVEVDVNDELGTLARAFNGMAASLRGLVSQVGQNTSAVAGVTVRLQEASEAMRVEADRQESAVEDTAESIERIHSSIREVNSNVETLSGTAVDTSAAAIEMDSSIAQIANHMDSLSETIDGTASSVVQMTTAIREIARGADELNSSTDSTVAALQLLSQAVKEVEGNAQESHSLSEKASQHAEQGVASVMQTVQGMQEIQQSFGGLEQIIVNLNEKSESIGEVVKVIEGVVEQTNLLALNAAIISSQAGEHGRAFSVVAEEVRNLAERTAGSTREISELIQAVQLGVSDAVTAMSQSNSRVEKGVSLSRQAGDILRTIGDSSRETARRVREIVDATERQARDIDKVDSAMAQVKAIAAQLNRGTHEQDSASADITRGVERMRELGQQVKHSTQEQRKESSLITQSVEVVSSRIKQILVSTQEQRKQGDQILVALQVFQEVTQQSSRRGEEMRVSLEELSNRSAGLEQEIGRFRL